MIKHGNIADDDGWMARALKLAVQGRGTCQPNPMVGAVIVRNGKQLGQGWHRIAGGPHAEINALASLAETGETARNADFYVTLEPCSTTGRTPPCTDALLRARPAKVVVGCLDDNPRHAGRAMDILRAAGIEVQLASEKMQAKCRALNEHFFWWIARKRPFVILKMAMTLDGKIALPDGTSRWITSAASRRYVQTLRQGAGAIMVGGRTALLDNPGLQVLPPLEVRRQPLACVWSSKALPASLKLMERAEKPIVEKPENQEQWLAFLRKLGAQDINCLLLEGGGELAASALASGIVNRVEFFVAPKLVMGRDSAPVVGGKAVPSLDEALTVDSLKMRRLGDDFLLTGYCKNVYRAD